MARGHADASVVTRREQQTESLVARLAAAQSRAERDHIKAELVELNLPLCDALADRYAGRGAELDDLVQVARVALLVAIDRFDPSAGTSLAAFAIPTITGELKRYFRDHCWVVRPPRRIQELRPRITRAREQLEQSAGRTATAGELAVSLGVDVHLVDECLGAHGSYRPLSLDSPVGGQTATTIGSALPDDQDAAARLTERIVLRRALARLSARDRLVLAWRFEEECTQTEIGRRLGVSQMQVSRIIRSILDQVRRLLDPPLAQAS